MLQGAGFSEVFEAEAWRLQPGAGYFVVRGAKSVIAWRQGRAPAEAAGFRIIAAHTDSPALKLRPRAGMRVGDRGFLATEIYGSILAHTWLDRDLKIAGALHIAEPGGGLRSTLVSAPDLKVRAMSLAPHLKKERKVDGVVVDLHKDLPVVFGEGQGDPLAALLDALSDVADKSRIVDVDLFLSDAQPGALVGEGGQFVSAPRIDNLFSSFAALTALVNTPADAPHTALAALYDAEEIGSGTWTGAMSNFLEATLWRVVLAQKGADIETLLRAKAVSLLISADMAHSEHPSFPDATDPQHVPHLNRGVAVKSSAKGNYATGNRAAAWFTSLCRSAELPLQAFMYRCDHGGGSSVGPYLSTRLGICGVDVGAPMLAMHSIRELCGARDIDSAIAAFTLAFKDENNAA